MSNSLEICEPIQENRHGHEHGVSGESDADVTTHLKGPLAARCRRRLDWLGHSRSVSPTRRTHGAIPLADQEQNPDPSDKLIQRSFASLLEADFHTNQRLTMRQ